MYRIAKDIRFCYGHRLRRHGGKCRHLHGHNARVEVVLAAAQLDEQSMVCDFAEVKAQVGRWLDSCWDHRLLLERGDPLIAVLREAGEELVEVPEAPTAENLARWIFEHARTAGLPVAEVRFWETPGSMASYSA